MIDTNDGRHPKRKTLDFLFNILSFTRSPDQWCIYFHIKILDPDGWRQSFTSKNQKYPKKSFETPVYIEEFVERARMSTMAAWEYTDNELGERVVKQYGL